MVAGVTVDAVGILSAALKWVSHSTALSQQLLPFPLNRVDTLILVELWHDIAPMFYMLAKLLLCLL